MSQFRALPALVTGCALFAQACSGTVGGEGAGKGGQAAGSGVGGASGSAGSGGAGGSGNASGGGNGPTSGVAPLTRVARLTHTQYQNTVADLFGITDRPTDAFAPDGANGFAFTTSVDYRVDGRLGGQYRSAAEDLAARVAAEAAIFSRVVPCTTTDAACQAQFIQSFGERAFRRPLVADEQARFAALFAQGPTLVASGDAFKDGVRLVVEAMLQSPQFLYRAELSSSVGSDGFIALDDWEIASRLSYLAWDTMPDPALFTEARTGMLHTADQVSSAAVRLFADPRALTKAVGFHEQAFRFSELSRISPDRMTYPNAPADLVDRIYPATTRFVQEVVQTGGGLDELLTAPYAYADSALAPLYGASVSGTTLTRIDFDPAVRKGLLMQVGHLASHAYAVKTDPIHRGLFILRDVLCRTIPDPPAGASMTPLPPTTEPIETTREEISLLTGQDACVGCHAQINAPGFAFENFDAVGQVRTMEGGVAVDTTGSLELDTGVLTFRNALELVDGLAASPEARGCYVAKWLEFSYGRQFATTDEAVRADLVRRAARRDRDRHAHHDDARVPRARAERGWPMTSSRNRPSDPTTSRMRRRRFLRGFGGAVVGLPFLEALSARGAGAQGTTAVKRFGVVFCCNGVDMDRWFPNGAYGALSDAHLTGTANEVLLPHRAKLLFPRGVHMTPRGFDRDGGGADDHGKGMAHKLTAQFADDMNWLALGPSVDQVIAAQVNPGSDGARRPPLNLMVGPRGTYKAMGYISYSQGISGKVDAVAAINNPWNAYSEFMNLNSSDPGAAAAQMRILQRRQSVLDLVRTQFDDLKRGPLSAEDKQKLDAHFTAIREIETGMGTTGISCLEQAVSDRASMYEGMPARTLEQEVNYPAVADLQVDIFAIALACDYTRVATMHFDRGAGGPTFKWDGMSHTYNHHKLSHGKVDDNCFGDSTANGCDDVVGYEDMLHAIDKWHAGRYARLLAKLDSYMEADGKTVLDNSVIMYTNELSDGKGHSFMDLPYILAGSCGGVFKQNEYVLLGVDGRAEDQRAPHNKLLNTLVNAMGIQSNWFGVAQGGGGTTMQAGVYDTLLV